MAHVACSEAHNSSTARTANPRNFDFTDGAPDTIDGVSIQAGSIFVH